MISDAWNYVRIVALFASVSLTIDALAFLPHVQQYEYLDYNQAATHRSKRSTTYKIYFESHGRKFNLALSPAQSVFAEGHKFEIDGVTERPLSLRFLVDGTVEGEEASYVSGSLFDGIFDGSIYSPSDGHFFVERIKKYVAINNTTHGLKHSVIYREDAIKNDLRQKSFTGSPGCGLEGLVKTTLERFEKSDSGAVNPSISDALNSEHIIEPSYLKYANASVRKQYFLLNENRQKRQIQRLRKGESDYSSDSIAEKDGQGYYRDRTCSMYIQTDQMLWDHIFHHEGQRSELRTKEEIYALVDNHIKAVIAIYERTDFNGIRGVSFRVQRITIFRPDSCKNGKTTQSLEHGGNPFCERNVDVSYFLNLNSQKDHSDFCLAYAFTYRDFVGGTLGLAWVASAVSGGSGGICEVFKYYNEGSGRVKRSLNTGIITLVNYNNRVPPRVSQLTLAHEIGHSFGAQHDPSNCQPGLPNGNYIMFASATSGDKSNNANFSHCSIINISSVLDVVLRIPPSKDIPHGSSKRNCFDPRDTAFCGNQLVEGGEECDCGFDEKECLEREGGSQICCVPRQAKSAFLRGKDACQLAPSVLCSPTQGKCCDENCQFFPKTVECSEETECSYSQYCTGRDHGCPNANPKSDDTPCQSNTKVCRKGECASSICALIGWTECFLTEVDSSMKCQLACQDPEDGKCKSSFKIPALKPYYQDGIDGIMLRPGHPCDNYLGYCDVFQKCRSVDSNGPLSRLKNLLFNPTTFKNVGKWIETYWWAVVLMVVGLVVAMALFIKCCAVHTPSSNPNRPPAHSFYETLRRPTTLLRNGGERSHYRHHARTGEHHHRHRHEGNRSRPGAPSGSRGNHRSSQPSTVPVPSAPPEANGVHNMNFIGPGPQEPPPPYSAAAQPPEAGPPQVVVVDPGGPPRGHRKNRKTKGTAQPTVELKQRSGNAGGRGLP